MPQRIDVVTFFNEFDMLEARLRLLDAHVDVFVIIEANHTFSGLPKPWHFDAQAARFAPWAHKIVHHRWLIDLASARWRLTRWLKGKRFAWSIESGQRNAALDALAAFAPADHVVFGDVDEIPSASALARFDSVVNPQTPAAVCEQALLYFNLGFKYPGSWHGTVFTTVEHLRRTGPEKLRRQRATLPAIADGGWHCSYFMDPASLRKKIAAFSHQELNTAEINNEDHLRRCMDQGLAIFDGNRPLTRTHPDDYPPDFVEVMSRYPGFAASR